MPDALLNPAELAFLVAARRAILATIAPDGRPRLVPVCFIVDAVDGVRILMPIDDKPKATDDKRALARVRDIEARPDVSLLVERWDEDWTRLAWLRLEGRAALLEPADVAPGAVDRLRGKYPQYASHALESSPMIAIDVERAKSWGALEGARLPAPTSDPENAASGAPLLIMSDGATNKGFEPSEDQIELPIGGLAVAAVAVSRFVPFLRLHFWGREASRPGYALQIDGPLRMVAKERESRIDPESGPDPAYLRLVEKTVSSAWAAADGSLEVEFTDGERLLVEPYRYEPWQLNGDDGTLIVSVAGGGLAVWNAQPG